jgi:Spy/CpxP family protein refolding chaperone
MRGIAILVLAGGMLAGCGKEPTGLASPTPQPGVTPAGGAAGEVGAFGMGGMAGRPGAGLLRRLPPNLALTAAQKQSIAGYVKSFAEATKSDRQALVALLKQARDARQGGASKDQVKAILEQGKAIRQRIQPARQQLRQQIEGVLTAEQKAWLTANGPKPCDRSKATPLTDGQKTQIKALVTAFRQANQADLETVKKAMLQARDARKGGASKDQVKAILEGVKPAADRLKTAREKLRTDVQAVLTADQQASGCFERRLGARQRLGAGGAN